MCDTRNALIEELNPTFLFTWKGTRDGSGERYHSHDYAEFSFVLSGAGRYRIDDKIYEIAEGDLLILNPGTRHQVLASDPKETPCTEFFVAFTDIQLRNFPKNVLPVPQAGPILHTTGDLRQKLFKICSSMEAESTVYRQGKYYMLQSYLIQMILLVIREQYEPRLTTLFSTERSWAAEASVSSRMRSRAGCLTFSDLQRKGLRSSLASC